MKSKKKKRTQEIGRLLDGTTRMECHGDCGEHFDVSISSGEITLTDDLVWVEFKCNWGDGKTLMLFCTECAALEFGACA